MFILSKKKVDKTITCNDSKFFNNDPKILEYLFPGILSSFYSSSRGDADICEYHDLSLLPGRICEQFKSKSVQSLLDTSQNNSHIKLPHPFMRDDQQGLLSSGKSVMEP
jgi:hypothetical protein